MLAFLDPERIFIVDTDASNAGVGTVLSHEGELGEQVIAYFSCTLSKPEKNYCVTCRELLAVVLGLHQFRPYLYGQRFILRTDHASLTGLLNVKEPEGQLCQVGGDSPGLQLRHPALGWQTPQQCRHSVPAAKRGEEAWLLKVCGKLSLTRPQGGCFTSCGDIQRQRLRNHRSPAGPLGPAARSCPLQGSCLDGQRPEWSRDAVIQPNQFDPELDPHGEAPEEVQTLRLQQDVSEWSVCLNNVSLFYVLLQLLP